MPSSTSPFQSASVTPSTLFRLSRRTAGSIRRERSAIPVGTIRRESSGPVCSFWIDWKSRAEQLVCMFCLGLCRRKAASGTCEDIVGEQVMSHQNPKCSVFMTKNEQPSSPVILFCSRGSCSSSFLFVPRPWSRLEFFQSSGQVESPGNPGIFPPPNVCCQQRLL